jgi:hypothetical protein
VKCFDSSFGTCEHLYEFTRQTAEAESSSFRFRIPSLVASTRDGLLDLWLFMIALPTFGDVHGRQIAIPLGH